MTINAEDKIISAIGEQLPLNEAIKKESLSDERVKELMSTLYCFCNEKQMLRKWKREYLQYGIDSYTYSSGLILLKSYMVLNGEYIIDQIVVTDSLENQMPIARVQTKYELKALQQFFIQSESNSSMFGSPSSSERSIATRETEIEINNECIGKFTRIEKNNSDIVYAEKYMPINRISRWELIPKDSFSNIDMELEILYCHNDTPVFAQLLNKVNGKSLLEGTEYHANDYNDAKRIVNSVNCEVDEIIKKIKAQISDYEKKENNPQKKIGTYH